MLERLVLPLWLRLSLALPLFALNLWVLQKLLLPLAPFPALFLAAALIAFLLDLPTRWLADRGLPRLLAVLAVVVLAVITMHLHTQLRELLIQEAAEAARVLRLLSTREEMRSD